MNKLLLVSFLLLNSCGEKNSTATSPKENPESVQKENIKSIEINSAGGQLGYVSHFIISKDSVIFQSDMMASENKKIESKKAIPNAESEKIFNYIDIENFKKAIEKESKQPVDGVDQTIILNLDGKDISKRNAYDNKTWNKILQLQSKYVNHE
ncbi:hypothetical protein [Kaistella antarctica]|uniref:Uncharacterized protein n=1 Tax=Kaistella antarctica TaxID=266748 RepID=A0A3S4YP17_9FLAO|nr:hypothetical protein [Kaistella antarctica]KEY20175.1 hypothetical protein HY04_02905 [Kaistella antarctica]SEV92749.1 hypothetical protein SAMN05421765_1189 [Kaistella antarctica]VEH94992.1 Uncharacterised protein [Kaistella antarctica]